jgi:hypothetical protein
MIKEFTPLATQIWPKVWSVDVGLTQHSFFCPQQHFQQEVTVYGEALHMHQHGSTNTEKPCKINRFVEAFPSNTTLSNKVGTKSFKLRSSESQVTTSKLSVVLTLNLGSVYQTPGLIQFQPACGVDIAIPACQAEHEVVSNERIASLDVRDHVR